MKDTFTDANFPRTSDGRVYHLGLRLGEVANRVLTVGDPSRARRISKFLDAGLKPFILQSERGFLTITGLYQGVPVSIIAIGMGSANMDFFVREVRESVVGDMAIIRLGSCGSLVEDLQVGSLTIPKGCVAVTRNYDYDFTAPPPGPEGLGSPEPPYRVSRLVMGHADIHDALLSSVESCRPQDLGGVSVRGDFVNASADSFYSSQGRKTSFPDHNEGLMDALSEKVPQLATLEMETHHLFHLAAVYPTRSAEDTGEDTPGSPVQLTSPPVTSSPGLFSIDSAVDPGEKLAHHRSRHSTGGIHASAIQMVFAQRQSQDFISPEQVVALEHWAGEASLKALVSFNLGVTHPDTGSVWSCSTRV